MNWLTEKLELLIDEHKADPGRPDKRVVCYGQVQYNRIYTSRFRPSRASRPNAIRHAIIVLVTLCETNGQDASLTPFWYTEMEIVRVFDVATIDCVIGRIKVGNRWGDN